MRMQEMADENSRPKDVDREFVIMFSITNEASSFMLRANLQKYLPGVPNLQYSSLLDSVPEFITNMNFHAINGEHFSALCDASAPLCSPCGSTLGVSLALFQIRIEMLPCAVRWLSLADDMLCNAGFMFCNGPPFQANVGERLRFYVMTLGTEAGMLLEPVLNPFCSLLCKVALDASPCE